MVSSISRRVKSKEASEKLKKVLEAAGIKEEDDESPESKITKLANRMSTFKFALPTSTWPLSTESGKTSSTTSSS